jgi:hypothetical protein
LTSTIQIVELSRGSRDVSRFLRVPYSIYRDDPNWVAPLLSDLKLVFKDSNPLFEHAEMKLWVAVKDGRDVGRIAGILDRNHVAKYKDATAFWGFFESIDDSAAAGALFDAVTAWAKSHNSRRLLGPMNPTTNDECGLLIDGFDSPPVIMMTYNPRYYIPLVEGAGFTKAKDLLAFHFHVEAKPLERLERIASLAARRNPDITIRAMRKKTLNADLAKVKEVYNAAWEDNWGFVPMTGAEMEFMAKRVKPLLVEEWALLAESKSTGEALAFMFSLPDYNEAIKPLRGKILTPKIFGFLKYLMGWKATRIGRVLTLGIKNGHRQKGIDAMLYAHALKHGLKIGTRECEVSWILEDNEAMLRPLDTFNASRYNTYRLYERAI